MGLDSAQAVRDTRPDRRCLETFETKVPLDGNAAETCGAETTFRAAKQPSTHFNRKKPT